MGLERVAAAVVTLASASAAAHTQPGDESSPSPAATDAAPAAPKASLQAKMWAQKRAEAKAPAEPRRSGRVRAQSGAQQ